MKLEYPHKCLNVLGNELRINIISSLKQKPKNVSEICSDLNQEQSKVSHSLKQLKKCNFVDYTKEGKERIYHIKSKILIQKSNKNLFELIEEHVKNY
ncbi:MAG: metalloregulator ArsR/SmtB family transcription factor [Candidatus ainarchaeum sp.]|nr:metalloregulator ArsR/SmtB family transcription factor [Candidatus ainarchaeum sp.]